jgi:hypothetical protein
VAIVEALGVNGGDLSLTPNVFAAVVSCVVCVVGLSKLYISFMYIFSVGYIVE